MVAEGVGFEPTEAFASRAFQARRFGRSRTPPDSFLWILLTMISAAMIRRGVARGQVF